jgi:hypothetical protein
MYKTYLDKEKETRCIVHSDMTENKDMMKIQLIIPIELVQKHAENILPVMGYPLQILIYF